MRTTVRPGHGAARSSEWCSAGVWRLSSADCLSASLARRRRRAFCGGLLFGLTPLDAATFVSVAVMFATMTLFASYLPRATMSIRRLRSERSSVSILQAESPNVVRTREPPVHPCRRKLRHRRRRSNYSIRCMVAAQESTPCSGCRPCSDGSDSDTVLKRCRVVLAEKTRPAQCLLYPPRGRQDAPGGLRHLRSARRSSDPRHRFRDSAKTTARL